MSVDRGDVGGFGRGTHLWGSVIVSREGCEKLVVVDSHGAASGLGHGD